MSWWISLTDENGEIITTDNVRQEGGTQVVGGTNQALLNVTYNYSKHFDFNQLYGLTLVKAHALLCEVLQRLGDDTDDYYWTPTEGNVKKAIIILVEFAEYAMMNNVEAHFNVN